MADGFVPPQEVQSNAKRGLELRAKYNRGGTEVGVARARDLSNGKALSLDTLNRMNSYFARHEVDKKGEGWGVDSAGYIAWLLWGGDAGRAWAKRITKQQDNNKEKSMANDMTTAFFKIIKADKNEDGTLMVYGKATDDSLDIDQQICDPVWLDSAMPEWFKSGGNIREQHSSIAAGVAKEYEKKADGHYINALVVDPVSVKKVDTGVLKGFSIGIKSPRVIRDEKAANGRIIDGIIVEVSLVDRPANPNCQLILAKSVEGEKGMWKVEDLIEKAEKPNFAAVIPSRKGEPADKELYNRVKAEAKAKFDVYPSAYANAWLVREYKKRGGKYKAETKKKGLDSDSNLIEQETDVATPALEIITQAKALATEDIVKFDQKLYETARTALAQLIVVEAEAMADMGHNEEDSIAHLLAAVHHLFAWYAGEEEEGEVMAAGEENEMIEMAANPGTAECDCAGCKGCMKSGGCADKMCSGHEDMEKSADTHKCLECGCGIPQETHGRSDVSTAVMVPPTEAPKSAEPTEEAVELVDQELPEVVAEATEEVPIEETPVEEEKVSEGDELAEKIKAAVEKAIKSVSESLRLEITELTTAKKAAADQVVGLESELAIAKSLAVAGGPKRTVKAIDVARTNDVLTKAATYKAKADAATDPELVKGYKLLANQFYAEAELLNKSN